MITYYIYHVPGKKVGATKNIEKRQHSNFKKYTLEGDVIETLEGPDTEWFWEIVGNREWDWADHFGYERGTHYTLMRKHASTGGKIGGRKNVESGQLASVASKGGKIGGKITGKITGKVAGRLAVESGQLDRIRKKAIEKCSIPITINKIEYSSLSEAHRKTGLTFRQINKIRQNQF